MSREELAEAVGTSKQYISHLENGVRGNPAFDLVEKLAKALGTDCRSFAADEDDPAPPIEKPKRGRPKKEKSTSDDGKANKPAK